MFLSKIVLSNWGCNLSSFRLYERIHPKKIKAKFHIILWMLSYLSIFVIYGRREGSKFLHFIQYWEFKQIKWKVWHVCHWHMAEDNLINSLTGSEKLKITSLSLIHVEQLSLNWLILKFFLSQAKYILKCERFIIVILFNASARRPEACSWKHLSDSFLHLWHIDLSLAKVSSNRIEHTQNKL